MIETEEGVNNLDEIAQVPGIDGFHIGPMADLAISTINDQSGLPPGYDLKEPRWVDAVQKIVDAAKRHGLQAGIQCSGPEDRRNADGSSAVERSDPHSYVLDSGAYGVVVPMISNREDARRPAHAAPTATVLPDRDYILARTTSSTRTTKSFAWR